ncbi:MAG: AMP-dependent synthetase and ligase [Caulobacteraceae bacterium]|nr:AMP-dependent synthetase and ligase [Caulobacteraceae bacterium]
MSGEDLYATTLVDRLSDSDPLGRGERPIGALLSDLAQHDPDHPALSVGDRTYTRGELDRAANRMARALQQLGVGQNDFVAIVLPTSFAHHVFSFAAWKLGAGPAPLPPKAPVAELQAMIELLGPRLVVGVAQEHLPGVTAIPADFQPDPGLSDAPLPDAVAKNWKASVSGGSTGRPKVIVGETPSLLDPRKRMAVLRINLDDVILQPAPLYHNAPFCQTNWTICWGGHAVEMVKFDATEWLRLVEKHRVRWAYLVPTMMNRIWALPEEVRNSFDLSSLEVVMHMAAPCPPWLKAAWIDWLGPKTIWEVYAGTEGVGAAVISGEEWLTHRGSVGKPMPEARILDEEGEPLPPGEIGEIFFNNPGAGAHFSYIGADMRRRGDWQSYGDMGYLDADGYLYLADRRTDMIVSGGANIYPAEVEGALEQHPAVAAAVVIGVPDPDLGSRGHAVVELRPGLAVPSAGELEAHVAERLARYKLPYTYELVSEPLKDDAGKVRRSAVRQARLARIEAGEVFQPLK